MNSEIAAFLDEFKGPFLAKPFTAEELIAAVDKVMAACTT